MSTQVVPEGKDGRGRTSSIDSTGSLESTDDPFQTVVDAREGQKMFTPLQSLKGAPVRKRIRVFCEDPHSSKSAEIFHFVYGIVIMLCILAFCTESLNYAGTQTPGNLTPLQYEMLELVFTIVFTVDIFVRGAVAPNWCCCCAKEDKLGRDSSKSTPFFADVLVWCDILSVLPMPLKSLLDITGAGGLSSYVKTLTVFRVLRIFKVTRNFDGAKVLFVTAKNSIKPLMVSFIVLFSVMVVVSAVLFFVEPCLSVDCVFTDQLNAAYYLVITLTTIGYGDQIPTTVPGRAVGVLIAFLGSFYMAMPLAIIGSKFEEAYKERELALVAGDSDKKNGLQKALGQAPARERRQRVLRLGFKITESLYDSINGPINEAKYHMKEFGLRAAILCDDIKVLFEVALRGTKLDRSRSSIMQSVAGKKKGKRSPNKMAALEQIQIIHSAKTSRKTRDKIWLFLHDPKNSRGASWFRLIQLTVVWMSIMLVGMETTPELNQYGEQTRMCKQVVTYFCDKLDANNETHRQNNPACFPQNNAPRLGNVSNTTKPYAGCRNLGGEFHKCGFPDLDLGYTCNQEPQGVTACNDPRITTYTVNGLKVSESASITVHNNVPVPPFDDAWAAEQGLVPMCERVQCVSNYQPDYSDVYLIGESMFILFFCIELLVRLSVMRSCRYFWYNLANLIDVAACVTSLVEIIYVPYSWGEPRYEVWGNGAWRDPATFRMLRIIVAIRFISLQRQSGGLKVIGMTIYQVWRKMLIPTMFFFLFTILFAGFFYVFEKGDLYKCESDFMAKLENGFQPKKDVDTFCVECASLTGGVTVGAEAELLYNGTCTLLVLKSDDTLAVTMVGDMFDAMWVIIITMTTVGYGGKYPRTMIGKIVAVVAAIFGSLYLAMPLTIVGNKFYDIFQQVEQETLKERYKTEQIVHARRMSRARSKRSLGTPEMNPDLSLRSVITLKRWVTRTKRKLEVQALSDDEKRAIELYLKDCSKMANLRTFERSELQEFLNLHTRLMAILSKHLIHRHAEGIDLTEATLY